MTLQRRGFLAASSVLILTIVVSGLAIGGSIFGKHDAEAQTPDERRMVSTSGHGEVEISPDVAMVALGVQVSNDDPDVALNDANERIDAIRSALEGLGIASDDITTGSFVIQPEYDYSNDTQKLTGFRVSHTVNVTVRNIEQAGDVVSTGVNAGANTVQNVAFTVADKTAALDQARELAVDNARHKAEELARLTDAALGPVVTISENSYAPGPIAASDAAQAESGAASPVPFNPGQSMISIDVQVSWELN